MRSAAAERTVSIVLSVVAGTGWAGLIVTEIVARSHRGHQRNPFAASDLAFWLLGWLAMLAAMMTPTLVAPLRHTLRRSFRHRRRRALGLLVLGYLAVWIPVIAAMDTLPMFVTRLVEPSWWWAAAMGVVALVWQCAPIKQHCLNQCHAMADLPAFGAAADRGALRFGVTLGLSCAGSCWALMWWSTSLPGEHWLAMALVTVVIIGERLDPPASARWRVRVPSCAAIRFVGSHARRLLHTDA